jgi:anti-anti-sigma factor
VQGEIDAHTASEFAESLTAASADGGDVTVDLAGVPFMDSSGLRVLIEAHQRIAGAGRRLVLAAPSDAVIRLLDVAGLNGLFPTAD